MIEATEEDKIELGLEPAQLLTTRHKSLCFDVTSRVDIDCARPPLCQAR